MTEKDERESGDEAQGDQRPGAAALSAATKRAQQALDSTKGIVSGTHLDEAGAKASATASNLYKEGLELLASNEDLSQATEHLSAAIRKNPLAAVGIAFSAGLLLALLTRG
jgi:ElaB/YqjD/DUF883 family membrane-anchored ribosome-binding protein